MEFGGALPLQTLPTEARDQLDGAIMKKELLSALMALRAEKAPRPNRFLCKFFKAFMAQLVNHLLGVVYSVIAGMALLPDWRRGDCRVPKAGLPSGRPFLLPPSLPLEVKLLTKTLASRLVLHALDLDHLDPVGFMSQCTTHNNIQSVYNTLALADRLGGPVAVLLTNIDRAFDSVSREYLFVMLIS
ncbi:hypothetical protein NDU88_003756 [Pleurodeles waltl]|uniref:Reverse transcriptase domain-containing protein n=1 Tax=Pleurodeles waltl TaxID=8319 RepID=A0AAV7LGM9_PLEWA|nr:hypothetical protein NDU88_003756 [Pleurodeles waltl]